MDNLGITVPAPIIIKTAPSVPNTTPVAVKPEVSFPQIGQGDTGAFDPAAADQQRFQAVQRVAQNVAEIFVVSDRSFTIFKDNTGQYVTRFTSLRDGKVTYVPEPNLFKIGGENDSTSVKIKI